jgi:hypothetical protein
MVARLDEERIETLRAWATDLAAESREDLRAAGKAITILIEEIERLRADVAHPQGAANPPLSEETNREAQQEPVEAVSSQSLGTSLRERLGAAISSRTTHDREG